ncbi:unnamed protein product [Ambrosiozyma monospora]|uniref:Unnamed protein product n=1 Tax=Ambrosiozyma monospora TaxID=43982 RepID=A0ACB5TE74_AMBMO|nr:unnamed protein product [Ambrosiozyma monospora]
MTPMLKIGRFYSSRVKLLLFLIISILAVTIYTTMTRSFSVTDSVKTSISDMLNFNATEIRAQLSADIEKASKDNQEKNESTENNESTELHGGSQRVKDQSIDGYDTEGKTGAASSAQVSDVKEEEKKVEEPPLVVVRNPLNGTKLDNEQKTNPEKAPVPIDNFGMMTDKYRPYEQIRIVKEKAGNPQRQNATLISLVRNKELYLMLGSIQQLESRFNKDYNYDWVFLNDEPFTDKFIELTSSMVSGTARYGIIPYEHWSYPDYVDAKKAKDIRTSRKWQSITYGSSESYRHMCRYNSMFFYKHPIMDEYQYYWRVEPEVDFFCDILYDPFKYMVDNKKDYGFTLTLTEIAKTIETLWSTSEEYFQREDIKSQLPSNEESLLNFMSDDNGTSYNLCHYWTNFEIANLDFYRSEIYENYVNHLDHAEKIRFICS